ncbi:MAG: ABC transporter permease [Firmicutes bacterium]|nr:ABC transporter permease [Bacillota bacterium]
MFFRMLRGAFGRQRKKLIMIAITVMLGASLATAMLNVMMDVGDKVNQELKTYGANITVVPKSASVVGNLYEVEDGGEVSNGAYLLESELGNIKTIFWAFNIVDFAPFIDTTASLDGKDDVKVVGTWFNHHMELPTGEILDAGVTSMRSWWDIVEGSWLDEKDSEDLDSEAMVGEELAKAENIHAGDKITVSTDYGKKDLTVKGIFNSGDDADNQIYTSVNTVQALSNTEGYITSIEVSALTTPDNELAEKAAKDPGSLTISQYETWYCTAYASSICYQIQEVITDSVASPVRQVADSEGSILEKTQFLMVLITILSLVGSALGITNLVTASVMERSNEIGLLKAIGATDGAISGMVLTQIIITGIIGAVAGYFLGFGFAQIIGRTVFNSAIEMKLFVIPIVFILVILVTLAGSIPAIRMLLRLRPAEVLHGR